MAQVIMEGTQESEPAKNMRRSLEKGHNRPMQNGAWVPRPTEYNVYIFSVAHRDLKAAHALLNEVEIPACPKGDRYIRARFIPHPFPQKVEDLFNTGREPYDYHSAERIAQDICNPSNPTLDQSIDDYGKIDPFFSVMDGCNFARYGVFWSLNQVPAEEELERAEKKRDNWYQALIREHDKLYAAKPASAANFGQDIRMALDYFGEQRDYHKRPVPVQSCPNCGSQIPAGAGFHFMPNGVVCVLDWQKAVSAGVKAKADVPDEKRWFKAPKEAA